MIAERDAEAGHDQQDSSDGELEPIDSEIAQVPRHRGQGEKKRANQERAGRPINPIKWNSETQELITTTSSFVQL